MKISKTKDRILDVAQGLFLRQGFTATSLDQICREAGTTKGGFFHYFKNKEDLAKAVLGRFCESSTLLIREACGRQSQNPMDRIFCSLDCIADTAEQGMAHKGCLIATFTQEMSLTHPDIQSLCAQGLALWSVSLKKDLRLAKSRSSSLSRVDVSGLADYCLAVIQGSQIMAKATQNPKVIRKSISHLKNYLILIFDETTTT